jgi:hypothetical protein
MGVTQPGTRKLLSVMGGSQPADLPVLAWEAETLEGAPRSEQVPNPNQIGHDDLDFPINWPI